MMARVTRAAAALLCLAATTEPLMSRTLEQTRAGSWTVLALADDRSGAFTGCEAQSQVQSGESRLLLSVDPSMNWSMGFSGRLGAQPGQTNTTRYRVDRGQVFSGAGTALSEDVVKMPLPDPTLPLRALREGRQLIVDGGSDRFTFTLRDMPLVLTDVSNCAEKWVKLAAAPQARPTAAVDSAPAGQPARALSDVERRLEAMTVAVNILSRGQIVGFELQPPDVPPRLAGHDVTWRAQNLSGSLRLVGLNGATAVEKVRAELISADILACPGRFTAESTAGDDGKSTSLFTLCQAEKGWSLNYLVIPRPAGGAYVLSLVGPSDKAEPLRAMAESLRSVALQVITGPAPSATATPNATATK